jgi:hypothetical protein
MEKSILQKSVLFFLTVWLRSGKEGGGLGQILL